MPGTEVLIIEDDDAVASALTRVLVGNGHRVQRASSGRDGLAKLGPHTGVVILDLGLPDLDGIDVCRSIRSVEAKVGILIVSARDRELDVVSGLDAGADDYLMKPFRLAELMARIRAQLRRVAASPPLEPAEVRAGNVRVDLGGRRAWVDETDIQLRPKEFALLALLVANAGRVVTRDRIMAEVWDTTWMGSTKTLDTHVLALRQKVGASAITTLRGVGYRFEA
ncbi:MAG: response regulator transcription factor [Thermoleophilia bacterium]